MGSKNSKSYSVEFKEQILKECLETNNYNLVARKHEVPVTTVYTWIRKNKNSSKIRSSKNIKKLEKELEDSKLENKILKELLKKTHQLWLKE